ncbi:MAG: SDR family NAD(P)-dependent oxidoreductase, partial [Candidatus Zixiibacteriota bacterium]
MEIKKKLAGKTALVTGAGRGVGRAIAEAFADAGANLVIVARSKDELGQAALSCSRRGADVMA